jgi:hypothetical protein
VFRKGVLVASAVVLLSMTVSAQRGAVVMSRNLAELTSQAETIVVAHVAFAEVKSHPQLHNLQTVVVTLRVNETLKGVPQETLTFRQFIWDPRDIADGAAYRRGDELLLLLNKENAYQLTSPAGLNQGRFEIRRDEAGKGYAVNGNGNQGLFDAMAPVAAALSARSRAVIAKSQTIMGPVALDELRQTILDLAAAQGGQR